MRPLLNYYGGKHRLSPLYGQPRRKTTCEPFAGGAGYSLFFDVPKAILIEKNPRVAAVWDYLINHATEAEIQAMDGKATSREELAQAGHAEPLLDFAVLWFDRGTSTLGRSRISDANQTQGGLFWSDRVKDRACTYLPHIRNWEVHCDSWENADSIVAGRDVHFFIDPPYQKRGGNKYQGGCNSKAIDFQALGAWCQSVTQPITVTEGEGADWLPFRVLKMAQSQNNSSYAELVWDSNVEIQHGLLEEEDE